MELLRLAGTDVRGTSVAGVQTCIELPGYGVALDMGLCPQSAVSLKTVLISHTHMDHFAAIGHHAATRDLLRMGRPTYVVPRQNAEAMRRLFLVYDELEATAHDHEVVATGPGDEIKLSRDVVARPFATFHRVPAQGYAIWRRTSRLRPELMGLPGQEIARRKQAGETVADPVEVPEVAFSGDTRIEVVETEEVVRKARLLILEASFVGGDMDVAGARERGHIHLDEIATRADLFENEAILLVHFSARHSRDEILRAIDTKLPARLRERVTPLLSGHP